MGETTLPKILPRPSDFLACPWSLVSHVSEGGKREGGKESGVKNRARTRAGRREKKEKRDDGAITPTG